MPDIFILKYLQKTLGGPNGAADWAAFKLKQSEVVDLTQADLENHDLRNYDLSQVNFTAARLYNVNAAGANLVQANLAYANLNRADLTRANLAEADLSGGNLEGVNASSAIFDKAQMRGCKLRGANLSGATFQGAELQNADFHGADLKGADFTGANLDGAIVEEAILIDCKIEEAAMRELRGVAHAVFDEEHSEQRRIPHIKSPNNKLSPNSMHEARDVLKVEANAERREIQKAYRKLAMQFHPDRVQHLEESSRKEAEEEFKRVQRAYELLTDESVAESEAQSASREYSLHELLQLAKQNPNNDRVFYNLGRKFFEDGMIDRAIGAYEKAIQLNPNNQYAAHNLKIARLTQTLGKK